MSDLACVPEFWCSEYLLYSCGDVGADCTVTRRPKPELPPASLRLGRASETRLCRRALLTSAQPARTEGGPSDRGGAGSSDLREGPDEASRSFSGGGGSHGPSERQGLLLGRMK